MKYAPHSAGLVVAALLALFVSASLQAENHRKQKLVNHKFTHKIYTLPAGNFKIFHRGFSYFIAGGGFYRHVGDGYIRINAPIGARLTRLHGRPKNVVISGRSYYFLNDTYYIFDGHSKEYIVVENPEQMTASIDTENRSDNLLVIAYPSKGQTEEQSKQDRFECHEWSINEFGGDPVYNSGLTDDLNRYKRAMTACLNGRGYTVN